MSADDKRARFTEANDYRGPAITCYPSGRPFYPLNPRPEDVEVGDIARALSHVARFGGHTRDFYSVAQHSVLVAQIVEEKLRAGGFFAGRAILRAALLHDAAEAYLGDVVSPMKPHLQVVGGPLAKSEGFGQTELRIMHSIHMGLQVGCNPDNGTARWIIKGADLQALAREVRDLKGAKALDNPGWDEIPEPSSELKVVPLGPESAERSFLAMWERLQT